MSIINSFDPKTKPIINPEDCYEKSDITLDACIINFSYKIMDALIEDGIIELVCDKIKSVATLYPVYRIRKTNIGIVKTTVGAPITAPLIQEISYIFSCRKFVLFGSCGGLDNSISPSKLIVPSAAYRDEGLSYHYLPPADYISIDGHTKVARIFDELGVDYVIGKTWTTDAFYRETLANVEARRAEGCLCVEMEIAACQAVATYSNCEFYPFVYRADNLDSSKWEACLLSNMKLDERLSHFYIALELAKRI